MIFLESIGSRASLSAKRMLTHSLFSFWAPPKTASMEGLTRQELALISGKHSLGAGVAKQREKSDKLAPHRFARAPRRADRDVAHAVRQIPHFHLFTPLTLRISKSYRCFHIPFGAGQR